jgi:hypothetical protein
MDHDAGRLVLSGWTLVTEGPALGGDKYWSPQHGAWLPVTTNSNTCAEDYPAVIRKNSRLRRA